MFHHRPHNYMHAHQIGTATMRVCVCVCVCVCVRVYVCVQYVRATCIILLLRPCRTHVLHFLGLNTSIWMTSNVFPCYFFFLPTSRRGLSACVCVCAIRACYMYNSLAPTLPNTCTSLFRPKYIDLDDFQRVPVLFFFPAY